MDLEELLLSDFPKVSDQDWKNKVIKDLRGKNFDETLVWEDESGIKHQPYYRKSDVEKSDFIQEIQQAQRTINNWIVLENKPEFSDALAEGVRMNKVPGLELFTKNTTLDFTVYKSRGASIVTELALALHHALEYMDFLTDSGMSAKEASEKLAFGFAFGNSYFSEIAKGRAFRYLISKLFSTYKIDKPVRIVGLGSDYYLAHVDAHTNLLRTTTQAMSAVLAGCDEVYVPAFDENADSSELGKRMSRNIQLILKEESHFGKIIDASSGSYYIEKLTAEFAEKAWEQFLEIESKGGLLNIMETGHLNEVLEKDRLNRIESYKSGERVLLGVNKFQNESGVHLSMPKEIENLAKELEL
jgi:hypothetical protein